MIRKFAIYLRNMSVKILWDITCYMMPELSRMKEIVELQIINQNPNDKLYKIREFVIHKKIEDLKSKITATKNLEIIDNIDQNTLSDTNKTAIIKKTNKKANIKKKPLKLFMDSYTQTEITYESNDDYTGEVLMHNSNMISNMGINIEEFCNHEKIKLSSLKDDASYINLQLENLYNRCEEFEKMMTLFLENNTHKTCANNDLVEILDDKQDISSRESFLNLED